MSKKSNAVNDAQLKARRTSLDKKDRDELINIILRKDSTERKNNAKIQELTNLLKEADELNEDKATRLFNMEKDINGMSDCIKAKQEQIDQLNCDYNCAKKNVSRLVELCNFRRKVIMCCVGVITILIFSLCICVF